MDCKTRGLFNPQRGICGANGCLEMMTHVLEGSYMLDLGALSLSIKIVDSSLQETVGTLPLITSPVLQMTLKAGVIQNFEVAYELCWKFIKRWLEHNVSPNAVAGVSRRELFRYAAENLLIRDVDQWMDFHAARNKTSHIYDQAVAEATFAIVADFVPEAKFLLQKLRENNA